MNLEHYRALLTQEKTRLEGELTPIATPDPKMKGDWDAKFPERQTGSADFSSSSIEEQADLREEFETNIAQEQSLESRLGEVVRAIERLDQGNYGQCRICAKPIPPERLEANPAAEFDMEHQPRNES